MAIATGSLRFTNTTLSMMPIYLYLYLYNGEFYGNNLLEIAPKIFQRVTNQPLQKKIGQKEILMN